MLKSERVYRLPLRYFCDIGTQSQEITQSGNMGRETPISFDKRKYVEEYYNGSW